jgi:MFS family permease
MSADTAEASSTRRASGWIRLLVLFGIASTVEAFTVSHVFRFMPLYLATVHVPPAEVPAWTGYLSAAFFFFGLPLVPFWGVWSERYGRIPIIARSAFVEMVVFAACGSRRTAGKRRSHCSWSASSSGTPG